jgi:predicted RNase H-like nuclease (RuvC/YqgF family)
MKRPAAKQPSKLLSASMTMRPLAKREPANELDNRLGLAKTSAPKTETDPRILAFEQELQKRKQEEAKMVGKLNAAPQDEKAALEAQLEERKAQEQLLRAELEQLKSQVQLESGSTDPYVAELEAEISRLKFAALAQQEAFEEQKEQLRIASEKAERLDEALDRMVSWFCVVCFSL